MIFELHISRSKIKPDYALIPQRNILSTITFFYSLQQAHWPSHMSTCAQSSGGQDDDGGTPGGGGAGANDAEDAQAAAAANQHFLNAQAAAAAASRMNGGQRVSPFLYFTRGTLMIT